MKQKIALYQGMKIWMHQDGCVKCFVVVNPDASKDLGYGMRLPYFIVKSDDGSIITLNVWNKIYSNELECAKSLFKSNKGKLARRLSSIKDLQKDYDEISKQQERLENIYGF
jgi:hypothetical protein